jgi:hypothetical protein
MIISTDKSSSVGVINHSLAGRWEISWNVVIVKNKLLNKLLDQDHQATIITGFASSGFFLNYGGDNGRVLLINA